MLGIFLDLETNGLDPFTHCILEIAYKIVDVSSGTLIDQFESVLAQPLDAWQKSCPASLKINGFSWKELEKGASLPKVKEAILASFQAKQIQRGQAVFICQNPSFDRAFFYQIFSAKEQEAMHWPYHWLDLASMHWQKQMTQRSFLPWKVGITKNNIANFYQLPDEAHPHRAMNGVNHLLLCYSTLR